MRKILVCFLALFVVLGPSLAAQNPAYADVAVIVNDSSAVSVTIGNYFAQQRGIPASRVLHIAVPAVQDLDSLGFEDLRAQVESALIGGNLLDSVNYLVTTKGMPARVSLRNGCDTLFPQSQTAFNRCTCLESELALILGPNAGDILQPGGSTNPYLLANVPFSRDSFGIFLISRLDGYTQQDAMSLVDHGGPDRSFVQDDVEVILDNTGFQPNNPSMIFFQGQQVMIKDSLMGMGYNVLLDTSGSTLITNHQDVMAYVAALNPDSPAGLDPNLEFVPGSIVHLWYNIDPVTADRQWTYEAGDAIANGAAIVATFASLGYSGPNFQPVYYVPTYLDTATTGYRFNAAEAVFQSNPAFGLQSIMYGDPKTSVLSGLTMSIEDPGGPADFALWPNPSTGDAWVRLQGNHSGTARITVSDLQGKTLLTDTWNSLQSYPINCDSWNSGLYLVQITQGKTSLTRKLALVKP